MTHMDGSVDISTALSILKNGLVTDVLVPGYIEREDSPPRFQPWTTTAYLMFDDVAIRFDSVQNYSQLQLSVAYEIAIPDEIAREEEEFAITSYSHLFLGDAYASFRCTQVRYLQDEFSDPGRGVIRCGEFEFENSWPIFIDPQWHFGIRLGGSGVFDQWLESRATATADLVTWRPS